MANFDVAIEKIFKIEGDYSEHINDKGGKTKFGITEKVAREFGYNGVIKELTKEKAKEIYFVGYWLPLKLDYVKNQQLAEILLDFGVNCGIKIACRSLQRALNLLNRNNLSWFDILIDGLMGPKTLNIINNLNKDDVKYVCKVIVGLQFARYVEIVEKNPEQEIFFRGWLNRIENQLQKIKNI